jgi:hypothetical protein
LVAPEPTYTAGSLNYTKSFIATCDMSGTPINVANATTPFNGDAGFRIKNVTNTNTYFPVGATFLPSATGEPPAPNRMMINNVSGTPNDFTVTLNYGDIGFTNAPVVERIWYVKSDATQATMQLFFTKRDITGWAGDENEVEGGFNYSQAALIQKDYNRNVLNLSAGADIQDFVNSLLYPYNTEIYGLYRIGVSNNLTNGIQQFNRFSIVNPFNLILPVTIVNFNAYKTGPRVKIEWTVADEINVDHYEAERSANGVNFRALGRISAFNHGSSINYSTVDSFPLSGNNFYRIKAIDRDGTLKYTSILLVNIEKAKTSMTLYPNPVRNRIINIQLDNLPNGKYQLLIYNDLGQQVFITSIEQHDSGLLNRRFILPLNIKPGFYIVKLFNERTNFIKNVIVE